MEILNHREMEYETNKLFSSYNISISENSYWFDETDTKAKELINWIDSTAKLVSIRDIELDYGLDCIRGYLMFEKIPKENDVEMDSWEECSLEGVYKFICKYYRTMNTIYHANKEGFYNDFDSSKLWNSVLKCEQVCLKYIHMENTMPNRHNILSTLMDELNNINKECRVGELTVRHHENEISHAVANAGSVEIIERNALINNDIINVCKKYMTLVSPFIPYITEQCWKLYDNDSLAILQHWDYSSSVDEDVFTLPIQINGKTKAVIKISNKLSDTEIKKIAYDEVKKYLFENEFELIYIEKKIINFVIKK